MSRTPDIAAAAPLMEEVEAGTSLWRDAWFRLRKNRMAAASFVVLALLSLACFLGPFVIRYTVHYTYEGQNLELGASRPSARHWLGTDALGRDQLTRLLHGGRVSLLVGLAATAVALRLRTA